MIFPTEKYTSFADHACAIGTIDKLTQERSQVNLGLDPLEFCLMHLGWQEGDNEGIEELVQYLDAQSPYRRGNMYESFEQEKEFPSSSEIEAPKFRFKSLHSHLRYEFLGPNETLLVIVSSYLSGV